MLSMQPICVAEKSAHLKKISNRGAVVSPSVILHKQYPPVTVFLVLIAYLKNDESLTGGGTVISTDALASPRSSRLSPANNSSVKDKSLMGGSTIIRKSAEADPVSNRLSGRNDLSKK